MRGAIWHSRGEAFSGIRLAPGLGAATKSRTQRDTIPLGEFERRLVFGHFDRRIFREHVLQKPDPGFAKFAGLAVGQPREMHAGAWNDSVRNTVSLSGNGKAPDKSRMIGLVAITRCSLGLLVEPSLPGLPAVSHTAMAQRRGFEFRMPRISPQHVGSGDGGKPMKKFAAFAAALLRHRGGLVGRTGQSGEDTPFVCRSGV